MDNNNWRAALTSDSRQKTVQRILDTLQRHIPFSGPEGNELYKIAARFEEKIYTEASDEHHYFEKISFKMLNLETPTRTRTKKRRSAGAMPANSSVISQSSSQPLDSSMIPLEHPNQNQPQSVNALGQVQSWQSSPQSIHQCGGMRPFETEGATHKTVAMDNNNWRAALTSDYRHRIVQRVLDTLQRHMPLSGPEGNELYKIAARFEENTYMEASDQHHYLKKIALKMLNLETPSPTRTKKRRSAGAMPANSSVTSQSSSQPLDSSMIPVQHQEQNQPQSVNALGQVQSCQSGPESIHQFGGMRPSKTEVAQRLLSLSGKTFKSLEDYVHHARSELQKTNIETEKWHIACLLNGIPNTDFHWIVHEKDPETFEEAVDLILKYKCISKKDFAKQELGKRPNCNFTRKHKQSGEYSNREVSKNGFQSCNFRKKRGRTMETC